MRNQSSISISIEKNQQKLYTQIRKSHYFLVTQILSAIVLVLYLIFYYYILFEYIVYILLLLFPINLWSNKDYFRLLGSSFRDFNNIETVSDDSCILSGLVVYVNNLLNLLRPLGKLSSDPPEDTRSKLKLVNKRIFWYTFGYIFEFIAILIMIILTFTFWSNRLRVNEFLTTLLSLFLLMILLFRVILFYNWQNLTKRWISNAQEVINWGKAIEQSYSFHLNRAD